MWHYTAFSLNLLQKQNLQALLAVLRVFSGMHKSWVVTIWVLLPRSSMFNSTMALHKQLKWHKSEAPSERHSPEHLYWDYHDTIYVKASRSFLQKDLTVDNEKPSLTFWVLFGCLVLLLFMWRFVCLLLWWVGFILEFYAFSWNYLKHTLSDSLAECV